METVYSDKGVTKVGVVVREGCEWVAYDLSDFEVYRGSSYLMAVWTLNS